MLLEVINLVPRSGFLRDVLSPIFEFLLKISKYFTCKGLRTKRDALRDESRLQHEPPAPAPLQCHGIQSDTPVSKSPGGRISTPGSASATRMSKTPSQSRPCGKCYFGSCQAPFACCPRPSDKSRLPLCPQMVLPIFFWRFRGTVCGTILSPRLEAFLITFPF